MRMHLIIGSLLSLLLLVGCASQSVQRDTSSVADGAPPEPIAPARYLAWYDGDFQTDYRVDRTTADQRLKELDDKSPAVDQADEYLEYCSLLDAEGRAQDAEKKIRAFMEKYPNDKRGAFLLGVHFWRLNKKELTNYFFNQLEKDASFPWKSLLYNDLGMLALQDKNRTLAIGYFEKATKANPPTAAPFVNLGALYLKSRSWSSAEVAFAKAADLDPEFEDAALGLGVALEGEGKNEEAHKVYSDFTTAHPGSSSVVYNDALVLGNRLGRKEEAAQLMLRYIQGGGKETAKAQEVIQTWR
jgi:tetratricopeptide (TPR) repeat protein